MPVTAIFPIKLEPVVFVGAVHWEILPDPLVARPIDVLELVHVKLAPVGLLLKAAIFMVAPGHTAILFNWFTVGVGFIVTGKFVGVPVQPLSVGVIIMVPVIFEPEALAGAFH